MKRIFALGLICLFALQLHAQRFRAGLSAGAVATDIKGADVHNDYRKLGFAVGGIANTRLSDQNQLQFEINYITKGSLQPPDSLNNGYHKLVLNYVEIPVVFRHRLDLTVGKKPWPHLELEIGASAGRVIFFRDIVDNYPQNFSEASINKTDVSVLAGVNYLFNENFYIGVRYSNSIIPALKRNAIPTYFITRAFNNGNNEVLQLSLHFLFGKSETTLSTPEPSAAPGQ